MLSASLFIITTAPFGLLVEGTQCKTSPPEGSWKPRAAYEAAFQGSPHVSLPLIGSGFNRTINIDGFCNDILMSSNVFTCSKKSPLAGEFLAYVSNPVTAPTGAFIRFDGVNCPLSGISMRRTEVGATFEAEIRFQFETCKAAAGFPTSPVSSAAVVMGLRKASGRQSNILPWMKEVCKVETTTPSVASVVVNTEAQQFAVGNGTCHDNAGAGTENVGIADQAGCKNQCMFLIQEAKAIGKKESGCTGFEFSAKAAKDKQCITFTGTVDKLDKPDLNWRCFNITMTALKYQKTTAAPPAIQALQELTQNLHLREVMAGAPTSMTTAKMSQVQPQKGDEGCFPSSWWFEIQDDNGIPASIPVMDAEWAELMTMLPLAPLKPLPAVRSTVTIDRVLVKTCNPTAAGWGRECVMPKLETVCDNKQVVNAVVTGILVPFLGWLLVRVIFNGLPPRVRQVQNYDFTSDEGDFPRCAVQGIVICCIGAVLACGLVAAGSSVIISYAFGAAGCVHGVREMIVIGCATGVPASLAMIIGLLYVYHSGSRHATNKETVQPAYSPTKGQKLMMIEVPEGHTGGPVSGIPINPDIMMTGNSAMSSYGAQGYPSQIVVDNTSAMLSSYQSPGGQ